MSEKKASNVVDLESPTANMYGCEPCPKCGSEYRAAYRRNEMLIIDCDDCGFSEAAEEAASL